MGEVLVSGLVTGFLYALVGLALSLAYRTGGVLNLAVGPVGFLAVFVGLLDIPGATGNALWGFISVVALGGVFSGALYLLVVRRVEASGAFSASVATLGAALVVSAVIAWIWGSQVHAAPRLTVGPRWSIGSASVSGQQIAICVVGLILFAVLGAGLKYTRLGVHIRSVGQGPLTSAMLGLAVTRTRVVVWTVAGILAAAAAFLSIGRTGLIAGSENDLLIAALAGLVIGGFDSLLGVALGGLLLGVLQNILSYYVASWLQSAALFIIVIAVLMVRPSGLIGRHPGSLAEPTLPTRRAFRLPDSSAVPRKSTSFAGLLLVVVLVLWAAESGGSRTVAAAEAAIPFAIVILGMYIVVGLSGQLVLGQGAFAAAGAYTAGLLAEHSHAGLEITLPAAFIAGAILGFALGIPCSRLDTVYLSVVTLVFAAAVSEVALHLHVLGAAGGLVLSAPSFFGMDLSSPNRFIPFELFVALVLIALVACVRRSAFGLDLIVGRDAKRAAMTSGARVALNRIIAFTLAAGVTSMGGVLYAETVGLVSPDLFGFSFSLNVLAAEVLGGVDSILGSTVGGAFLGGVPQATSGLAQLPDIIFGGALILLLMLAPKGIGPSLASLTEYAQRRVRGDRSCKRESQGPTASSENIESTLGSGRQG